MGQYGVYQEIVPAERIVNTESWEDWDAGETLVTTVLVEQRGRTTFTSTIRFPSQEVRDLLIKSGMADQASTVYDQLDALLRATPWSRHAADGHVILPPTSRAPEKAASVSIPPPARSSLE